MIDSKGFGAAAIAAAAAAVVGVIVMMILCSGREASYTPAYAEKLFNGEVISIEISADADEWQQMLDNAMNEEYIMADVTINGTLFSDVGIRPKGNNSLQMVSSSDSDRYGFKIKFDEYVSGQSCFGLDTLVLNNMIGDPTYMKEYTTFDMMKTLGIETPYFGYSDIKVNGENWGLYFTLESYNDSYELRASGDEKGVLYNVKSVGGMGEKSGADISGSENPDEINSDEKDQERDFPRNNRSFNDEDAPESFRSFGGENSGGFMNGRGGMGAGQSGGSLVYSGDDPSDYPSIFENAVGGDTGEEDYAKVISALKALNEGENIEDHFDVDEILRYLAVHTFVVNLDSYSSEMAQNYYIYEHDGVIKILPWDYNYAWGAFQGGGASETVNFPIDTPVSGVEMSERPLISKLFENKEYLERYHEYLLILIKEYFTDGGFESLISKTDLLIGEYVANDATAFYSYDEYQSALEQFRIIARLRAESVSGQINRTIPSTSEGQSSEPDKLTDTSEINMNALGSGGGIGGGKGGFNREMNGGFGERPDGFDGEMGGGFGEKPDGFDGEIGDGFSEKPDGFDGEMGGGFGGSPPQMPDGEAPFSPRQQRNTDQGTAYAVP